jgi:hypothetical protein
VIERSSVEATSSVLTSLPPQPLTNPTTSITASTVVRFIPSSATVPVLEAHYSATTPRAAEVALSTARDPVVVVGASKSSEAAVAILSTRRLPEDVAREAPSEATGDSPRGDVVDTTTAEITAFADGSLSAPCYAPKPEGEALWIA